MTVANAGADYRINLTSQYIHYIGVMTYYYTASGILRILLVILIAAYLCSRKLRKKKMSTF